MGERPILFSGEMVRAILEGRKTQTRRIVSTRGVDPYTKGIHRRSDIQPDVRDCYIKEGDLLWVRETWCFKENPYNTDGEHDNTCVHFRADGYEVIAVDGDGFREWRKDGTEKSPWKPSIHMPRWASRITLKVTSVRVERLNDISEDDAISEGVKPYTVRDYTGFDLSHQEGFAQLWQSIYGNWDANPWVWVIEFEAQK